MIEFKTGCVDLSHFNLLADEILSTASHCIGGIGRIKEINREGRCMTKLARFLIDEVITPYKDTQVYTKLYDIEINENADDEDNVVVLSIRRKRLPNNYDRSDVGKSVTVGYLKNPALYAMFRNGKMCACRMYEGIVSDSVRSDKWCEYGEFGAGRMTQTYNRVIDYIRNEMLGCISNTPVDIKIGLSPQEKKARMRSRQLELTKEKERIKSSWSCEKDYNDFVLSRRRKNENKDRVHPIVAYKYGCRSFMKDDCNSTIVVWLTKTEHDAYKDFFGL